MTRWPMACIRCVLPETDAAVQEERVVGARRGAGDRLRGGVGEPVGVADDELFESITDVEVGGSEVFERASPRRGRRPERRAVAGLGDGETQLELVPKSSLKTPII